MFEHTTPFRNALAQRLCNVNAHTSGCTQLEGLFIYMKNWLIINAVVNVFSVYSKLALQAWRVWQGGQDSLLPWK